MKIEYLKDEETFQNFLNRGEAPLNYEKFLLKSEDDRNRVIAILQGKIVPPFELEIQPSSICNLRCKHCFGRNYNLLPNKIGKEEFKILAEKIEEFKENDFEIEIVKFCGTTGEPLVNSSTPYALNLFKAMGKKVVIFTNGLNLDKIVENSNIKYYESVARTDRINLSLDAGSEKTFHDLKGKYGFERIMKSLEEIAKIRDKENTGIDIRVSYVIGGINYGDVVEATKRVKEAGANEIIFRVDFTDEEKIKKASNSIIDSIKYAKEYQDNEFKVPSVYSDAEISGKDCGFNSNGIKCFNQKFWACIGPDCGLYACGHRTHAGIKSIGNLLENSFRDLWLNNQREYLLESLPDSACKNCSPSSKRRNDFMTFLSGLHVEKSKQLIKETENIK